MSSLFSRFPFSGTIGSVTTPLGERIKQAIDQAGLAQREVAKAIGVHPSAITKLVKGDREPKVPEIIGICRITGWTPEQLLGTSRTPPPLATAKLLQRIDRLERVLSRALKREVGLIRKEAERLG